MRRRRVGEEMKFCSVSPRVGNVKNKDPSLIETVLMNLHKWLAALFVLLALSGCASMATDQLQAPVPSYLHDDGPDMRTGNMGM